jgi:alpha-tubulin suppressor-like RCC1 family protein
MGAQGPAQLPRRRARQLLAAAVVASACVLISAPAASAAGSSLFAWGANFNGQLGIGTHSPTSIPTPTQVRSLSGVVSVSGSYYNTVAALTDGSVWGWGLNENGEVGDGTTAERDSPVKVPGLSNVVSVYAGYDHTLALLSNGTVMAWGLDNFGQLGNGSSDINPHPTPTAVEGVGGTGTLQNVVAIAAGYEDSFALLSNGTVVAWGNNNHGPLGNGTSDNIAHPTPEPVLDVGGAPGSMLQGVSAIAAGGSHSLALLSNGGVVSWGDNTEGDLGDGTTSERDSPVSVFSSGVTAIAAGQAHSLALHPDGSVSAWGENDEGELGGGTADNNPHPTPVQVLANTVAPLIGVTAITASGHHSVALLSNGNLAAWGHNSRGELGDGTLTGPQICAGTPCSPTPVSVQNIGGIGQLGTGDESDGTFVIAPVHGSPGTGSSGAVLSGLGLSNSSFPAAPSGPSARAAAVKYGTIVSYQDSVAATTTFTVEQRTRGVRKDGRCVRAPKHPPMTAKRCTYLKALGHFTRSDTAGMNRFRFTGRVKNRKLAPGKYVLVAIARTATGASRPVSVKFRIIL